MAVTLVVTGCGAAPTVPAPPTHVVRFAQSAGVIPADPDEQYVVNLLFLAESGSPIWDGAHEVVIESDVLRVEGVETVRGDETPWGVLGNLSATVRPTGGTGELRSIRFRTPHGLSPLVEIGHWDIVAPREQLDFASEEYPVSTPGCHALAGMDPVPLTTESDGGPPAVRSLTEGTTVRLGAVPGAADGFELEFGCDDSYDVYAIQPEVATETEVGWLPQILVGTASIDDVLLGRIAERPAVEIGS